MMHQHNFPRVLTATLYLIASPARVSIFDSCRTPNGRQSFGFARCVLAQSPSDMQCSMCTAAVAYCTLCTTNMSLAGGRASCASSSDPPCIRGEPACFGTPGKRRSAWRQAHMLGADTVASAATAGASEPDAAGEPGREPALLLSSCE